MKLRNRLGMDHAAELLFCYKMLCGYSAEDDG